MWVRTTLTIKRWTEEKTGCKADLWDERERTDISRLSRWKRGHLLADVESSTDASSFSSEGECQETNSCCWKHKQCAGHIIHPFSDCGHHNLHVHAVSHCNCESRLDCSERTNSSSQDTGSTCSRDGGSTCFNIIHTPCFELIPEEECMEQFWYSWCKNYRPVSVAVIHHPVYHACGADDLHEEETEEKESPSPSQVCPTATPINLDTGSVTGAPDSAAPITIWRSESPTDKSQGSKVIKKVKKKEKEKDKQKDKEDEMTDEKAKLKKKSKNSKLTKTKSPVKSQSSPPDLSQSVSPREVVKTSESSPESREELESEDSYNERGRDRPSSSEDAVESSPKKKEKNTARPRRMGQKPYKPGRYPRENLPQCPTPISVEARATRVNKLRL